MKVKVENLEEVVACIDCKYYLKTFSMWLSQTEPRCTYNYTPEVNLVTGKIEPLNINALYKCRRERDDEYMSNCGSKGKNWKPRKHTAANTFKVLKRPVEDNV